MNVFHLCMYTAKGGGADIRPRPTHIEDTYQLYYRSENWKREIKVAKGTHCNF